MFDKKPDILRQNLIDNFGLKSTDAVGFVSSFAKEMRVEESSRELVFVANTSDIDSADEVVVPDGADTTYFDKQGSIFADHCYKIQSCIGSKRNIKHLLRGEEQYGWLCRVHMADLKSVGNMLPDTCLLLAKEGVLSCSIGFQAFDYGRPTPAEIETFGKGKPFRSIGRKWSWTELSMTCQPCNVNAALVGFGGSEKAMKARGELITKRLGVLDNLLCKGLIPISDAERLGFSAKPTTVATQKVRLATVKPFEQIRIATVEKL